jgi:epoxyqueuosine reductase
MNSLESFIKRQAAALGFALCGICRADPSDHGAFFRRWLAEGRHGQMDWLERNVEVRLDPRKLLEGARSIICVADYIGSPDDQADPHPLDDSEEQPVQGGPAVPGRIARYAQVSDYHKVIKKRLHTLCDALGDREPAERFRACVDTAPLAEREHAQRAGLGWVGKNTLLLNRRLGSHLLLGAIATTLDLEPDTPQTDHCGRCTRCIDACPTDCIRPWSVDASRCISYLTIEHRNLIDSDFFEAMDDWLFGCDVCQEVCPFVQKANRTVGPPGRTTGPWPYQQQVRSLDAAAVVGWSETDRRGAVAGTALKRAKRDMFKRNALIVLANQLGGDSPGVVAALERAGRDEGPGGLVAQTIGQLQQAGRSGR